LADPGEPRAPSPRAGAPPEAHPPHRQDLAKTTDSENAPSQGKRLRQT